MRNPSNCCLAGLLLAAVWASPVLAAFDAGGFARKFEITASGYAGTSALTNFPVLVRLSTDIPGFSYGDFLGTSGSDLRFTDESGTELPFEIDTWNPSGTSLVWVAISEMRTNAVMIAYYANVSPAAAPATSAVWSGYTGVWHLDDADSTGVSHDSGPYAIDGANAATTTRQVDGAIGACRRISDGGSDGKTGGIVVPGYVNLAINSSSVFSIGGWLRHKKQAPYWDHVFYKKTVGGGSDGFAVEFYNGSWCLDVYGSADDGNQSDSRLPLPGTWNDHAWFHLELVYNGANVTAYTNGVLALATTRTSVLPNNHALAFGANSDQGDICWKGEMDELRVVNGACSADWIAAEYATASVASFLAYGDVSRIVGGTPIVSAHAPAVIGTTSVTATGTVVQVGSPESELFLLWGTDPAAFTHTNSLGMVTQFGGVSTNLTDLRSATSYSYRFVMKNANTQVVSSVITFATRGTLVWTGSAGTSDWSTPGNWDLTSVPASTIDVTLPAGADVSVAPGVSAVAASITVSGVGVVSLALGDGASLAVGGDFTVTGMVACALSGGTVSMGGTLACGYASTGTVMTVQKTVLTAGDLLVGCWADGSRNSFVVTNGAVVTLSGRAIIGLSSSATAPASSNMLLVAQGGVLAVPYVTIATDTNAVGLAWNNNLVIDGGIVTNTIETFVSQSSVGGRVKGCLVVKNGGLFFNPRGFSQAQPAIFVRPGENRPNAFGGIVVVDGGKIQTGGMILYADYTGGNAADRPFLAITNGTVICGACQAYAVMHVAVAGSDAVLQQASVSQLLGGHYVDLVVPPEGWLNAPVRFPYADTQGPLHLTVDASGYAGTTSADIPLFEAYDGTAMVPMNYLADATIILPGRKWKGAFIYNAASNIVYISLTAPARGFVIHICDVDIDVPYDWATNACPSIVATDTPAISNALVSAGENGLNRWQSYALGLDPNDASSVVLCDAKQDAAASSATFYVRNVVPVSNDVFKIVYVLEGSTDGLTWPYESTSETNALSLVLPSAYRLFRLRTDIVLK